MPRGPRRTAPRTARPRGAPTPTLLSDFAPWIHRVQHLHGGRDGQVLDGWWQDLLYGLLTCEDGTAIIRCGSRRYRLAPGAAALIEPGRIVELSPGFVGIEVDHELVRHERSIELQPNGWVRTRLLDRRPQPAWSVVFASANPVLVAEPLRLQALFLARHLAFSYLESVPGFLRANHRLTGFLLEFHRHTVATVGGGEEEVPTFARRLETLIDEGLREGITVSRLAAICGMSRSGLDRRYRRERGIGLAQAIDDARLHHACDLLQATSYGKSIATTARRLGFSDGSAFARWFRKRTGSAPSAWRRVHRG